MAQYSKHKLREIEQRNKSIVKLRDELEMSWREIGNIVGLTYESARNIYYSEKKKLTLSSGKSLDK